LRRRSVLNAAGLGAGVAAGALAACSAPGAVSQPAPGGPPVTLSFMSGRGIAMDQFAPAWTEYGQQHNVTFEVERTANVTENAVKLTALFAADQGPDLFDANTSFLPRMYDGGAVLALDRYLSADRIALDRDWAVLGIERWRQKAYAVPYWVEPFAIYYNKSLFRQKGVEDPWSRARSQGDWTMEEMVDAARKINDPANDVYGLDWEQLDMHGIGPLIWTQGVSHLQYDPRVEFRLQLPEVVSAVSWASDWMVRQGLNVTAPAPEAGAARTRIQGGKPGINQTGGTNRFATGKIGMHWRSVNDWQRMWPTIGTAFEWDMLPVPRIGSRPGCSWSAGHPLCAYARTKHPDPSWAFMRWMMGDEFQGFLARNQYLVPAKKSHQAAFFRPPAQYPYQHPAVFADVYRRPYGISFTHYRASDNATLWGQEMPKVIRGEVALSSGLGELERRLNQEIEYGGGENPFKGVRWPVQPK
jgi:ABC-type glycerol-3-phosphate transport system substrate-binding protein